MIKSIFCDLEDETSWKSAAIHSIPQISSEFTDILLLYPFESSLKSSIFRVTKTLIYELDEAETPIRSLNLILTVFEPFIEESETKASFGFYLNSEAYYVTNEEELEKIVKVLRKSCIITHIDEDFVFIKQIGKGSTAEVFLCEDVEKSQQYAVKRVGKEVLKNKQNIVNLAAEIQIYRTIEHENICKLFFVFEDEKFVYLILEFMPFGSLLHRVAQKITFTEKDCMLFTKNLLNTLDFMHCKNIVHRDLKLENILMSGPEDHHFKLADLGLAYDSHFLQNKKCGSPGYVAPEMLRDEDYDCKIDIFAAGVILFILLHGHHPFEARNLKKMLFKNLECDIKVSRKISPMASEVVQMMMEPYQELRPSAMQMLEHPWFETKQFLMPNHSDKPTTLNSSNIPHPDI